jgi:eukaryotic-like serine/threonine-protein kinase
LYFGSLNWKKPVVSLSDDNPLELEVDQALAEYMERCDRGERLDRDAFLSKYPGFRHQLEDLLNAADWIEQLAGPTAADSGMFPKLQLAGEPAVIEQSAHVDPTIDETLPHIPRGGDAETPHSLDPGSRTLPMGQLDDGAAQIDVAVGSAKRTASSKLNVSQLPCQFGDYELLRVLGRGGMGVVYAARQLTLDRIVAVKMIRSGALASAEEVRRFYSEARNAARLAHPNIVTVYQCGEIEGHHFFSMDFVEGTDLSRMSRERPIEGKRAARYVRDVARAIQFAHDRGILHRDLKPANVLIDTHDTVHITDFGLAKTIGHDTGLTASGAALGTPSYMSPEQAAGRVDEHHHATDIYSLGAILFSLVTGQPPFRAANVVQTLMHVIHRPAPRVRTLNQGVHADLETIVDKCLQKSPDRRYVSAQSLADDLDRYLTGLPIQARPISKTRRAWYWLLGVPIFGAILDHRVVEPTDAHRWFQRGLISIGLLMLVAWVLLLIPSSIWYKNRMPRQVRFASGVSGGSYDAISNAVADALARATGAKTQVITSNGSSDNLELLTGRKVDLAMLQSDALGLATVVVVAPMYYEVVHILVRNGLDVGTLADLRDKRVIVGSPRGGSHAIAQRLLQRAGIDLERVELVVDASWKDLADGANQADAAIAVLKAGSVEMRDFLRQGEFSLLPVPDAWEFALEEPAFHSYIVSATNYPGCPLPESGITTVATTAYLSTRYEASQALIEQVLVQLYEPKLVEYTGILSAERAAHWQGIAWHPAARDFFQAYRGIPSKGRDEPAEVSAGK